MGSSAGFYPAESLAQRTVSCTEFSAANNSNQFFPGKKKKKKKKI
jgi:hypothetical protein